MDSISTEMVDTRQNAEYIGKMKKAFAIFDVDGDGTITTKVSVDLLSIKMKYFDLYFSFLCGCFNLDVKLFSFQELGTVMSQLGSAPPWAVLQNMIDNADSDRNGKVIQIY